jgi:phosphate transport system permease protein
MSARGQATPAARFEPDLMRRRLRGTIFYGAALFAVGVSLLALLLLLVDIAARGLPALSLDFLTGTPSRRPSQAGIMPALVGSILMGVLVGIITFPLGIGAAIYLREYARDSRLNRLLRTNISNLAGVPSIIYGIFGLELFVRAMSLGFTLIAGALTLSLLILPVVIIAAIEALDAVPDSQREGAYALGATRWQMVSGAVLPAAGPGILTGIILAMARAIGETAPLILVGAVTFVTYPPNPFSGGYTVLPIQVYQWAQRSQEDFRAIAATGIIVILAVLVLLNILAVLIRIRLSRHIQW